MGRGNFCASGDLAMQWYIDYDQFTSEDGEYDELFQHEMVNYEMVNQIMNRYPSFWKTNAWIRRDAHALLENKMFYIGIADNENTLAVFISSKDEFGTGRMAIRHFEGYKKGIQKILLELFGEIYVRTSAWTSARITEEETDNAV